jgi:hypothetical protein
MRRPAIAPPSPSVIATGVHAASGANAAATNRFWVSASPVNFEYVMDG